MKMENALEWLDRVITIQSDTVGEGTEISDEELNQIFKRLRAEKSIQIAQIRTTMLSLDDEFSQQFFISNYYAYVTELLDLSIGNRDAKATAKNSRLLCGRIISFLSDILTTIYKKYWKAFNENVRPPFYYLRRIKSNWRSKLTVISNFLHANDPTIAYVILGPINIWLSHKHAHNESIREMIYFSKLLSDLEAMSDRVPIESHFTVIEKYLIRINFNSRDCLNHITIKITHTVNQLDDYSEKLDQLFLFSKELKQQFVNPKIALNPNQEPLIHTLGNWLSQEITYLESKLRGSVLLLNHKDDGGQKWVVTKPNPTPKVLCMMTVDQMAIFFRAADESKVLEAKSISSIYKQIKPFLSSRFKQDLSPNSLRAKSYVPEDRDKAIVIDALERMVKKIKEF